jgi:hypothetical protein
MSQEIKVGTSVIFRHSMTNPNGYGSDSTTLLEGIVLKVGKVGKALFVQVLASGTTAGGLQKWVHMNDVVDTI